MFSVEECGSSSGSNARSASNSSSRPASCFPGGGKLELEFKFERGKKNETSGRIASISCFCSGSGGVRNGASGSSFHFMFSFPFYCFLHNTTHKLLNEPYIS